MFLGAKKHNLQPSPHATAASARLPTDAAAVDRRCRRYDSRGLLGNLAVKMLQDGAATKSVLHGSARSVQMVEGLYEIGTVAQDAVRSVPNAARLVRDAAVIGARHHGASI